MPYIIIVIIFAADRLTKLWAANFLAENGPTELHPYLTIVEAYNRGIAFGMFQGVGPLIGWLTIGVVIAMLVYIKQTPRHMWLIRVGLALIVGGALGNQVDRILVGEVLDFIKTPLRWGIFNVADISINVGMIVMIVGSLIHKELPEDSEGLSVDSNQSDALGESGRLGHELGEAEEVVDNSEDEVTEAIDINTHQESFTDDN